MADHDEEHFRDSYREAVAYLDAVRDGDGRGMSAVRQNTPCDPCLVESQPGLTPAELITTYGYATQYWTAGGAAVTAEQRTTGNGGHTASGPAAPPDTLFTLVDRVEQLSARGNQSAPAEPVERYRTTFTVDRESASTPNTVPPGEVCAGPAGNTGLVCAVAVPHGPAGNTDPAVTRYSYDTFGQRVSMRTPNAGPTGEPYVYTYAGRDRRDLSGTVSADGWLLAVTDPDGKYVAFGHDAAGNTVRTWDRNATDGKALPEFPGTLAAPPDDRYSQTLYANGEPGQAIARPWRWPLSERTPLGDTTSRCVDPHGNPRLERPARGSAGQPIIDCAAAIATPGGFDVLHDVGDQAAPDDQPTSVLGPEQRAAGQPPTTVGYDGFGNPTVLTDPRGVPSRTVYDAVNRPVQASTVRATTAQELPAGVDPDCPAGPDGASVCTASTGYDMHDNPISSTDPDRKVSTAGYNAVGWKVQTTADGTSVDQPRDAGPGPAGSTSLRTEVLHDADGNPTSICPPRQFGAETDTGGACTGSGAFSRHYGYDPAGRMLTETAYRAPGTQALVTGYRYDPTGNQRSVTDANGHTTQTGYDSLDRPVQMTRPRSQGTAFSTTMGYDSVGNRLSVTEQLDAAGATRTDAYRYDAANRLVDSVTGAVGPDAAASGLATGEANVRTRQIYDADGRVVGQYGPRAFAASVTDPDERFLTWTDVDRNGRPVATFTPRHDPSTGTAGDGDSQGTECPAGVQPQALTGGAQPYPSGVGVCVSRMGYDAADRMSVLTLPTAGGAQPADTARKITVGYTADGLRTRVSGPNPAGTGTAETLMAYDGSGRPVRTVMPAAPGSPDRSTTMAWTADGLLAVQTAPGADGNRRTTRFGYDPNGGQVRVIDPLGQSSTTTFTADGLTGSSSDTGGHTVRYEHDRVGNVTRLFDASATARDATNPAGVPTVFTYTADDLVATEARPHRADGNRLEVAWEYDGAGRKSEQRMRTVTGFGPGAPAEFDPAGRVQAVDGGRQSFAYSPAGRLSSETGRAGETIRTSYDPDGNPLTIADSSTDQAGQPSTLSSAFYLDGLLRSTGDGTSTTSYGYDGAGQVSVRTHGPDSPAAGTGEVETTTFGYNDAGARIRTDSTATTPAGVPWTAAYDPAGRMVSEAAPNGQVTTHTYLPDDSLQTKRTVADASEAAALVAQWSYSYDRLGRQLSQDHEGQAVNGAEADSDHRYRYDPAGRVVLFADGPGASRGHTATFDANGNRLTYTTPGVGTQTVTYSPDNTQASSTDLDGSNGRPSSYTAFGALAADGCYRYGYDGFDRLVSTAGDPAAARCAAAPSTSYAYDGLDRQRSTSTLGLTADPTAPASTTGLHYDGLGTAVASETMQVGTASATSKAFTLSPSGQPLSLTNQTAGLQAVRSTAYLTDDGTGTITTITGDQPTSPGATGTAFTTCTARFDPWGTATTGGSTITGGTGGTAENGTPGQRAANPCGSTATGQAADSGNDRFYRGERRDTATGNYQLGSRTYDPTRTGFLTPDSHRTRHPAADLALGTDPLTTNRYNYVNGDPVNLLDPTGHRPECGDTRECNKYEADHDQHGRPQSKQVQESRAKHDAQVTQDKSNTRRDRAMASRARPTPGPAPAPAPAPRENGTWDNLKGFTGGLKDVAIDTALVVPDAVDFFHDQHWGSDQEQYQRQLQLEYFGTWDGLGDAASGFIDPIRNDFAEGRPGEAAAGVVGAVGVGRLRAPKGKPVNLPSASKVDIDDRHIFNTHVLSPGQTPSSRKTYFPQTWNQQKVRSAVRSAYAYSAKAGRMDDGRVRLRGMADGVTIEMILNRSTNLIETAYPIGRR